MTALGVRALELGDMLQLGHGLDECLDLGELSLVEAINELHHLGLCLLRGLIDLGFIIDRIDARDDDVDRRTHL